jgi:Uncharacterised nucleotidyltransferase
MLDGYTLRLDGIVKAVHAISKGLSTGTLAATLAPEDQLCLLLARGQLTPEEQARACEFLSRPLQWPVLLDRAYAHQVYPLIYRNLRQLGFLGVPEEVQASLKGAYLANALRNQLLSEELAHLLRLLSDAGIPVIPLKGVALAEALYGDPAARTCADTDLLIPAGEVVRARRLILLAGYSSPFTEDFFVHHQFHTTADCPLFREEAALNYLVEIHWTLLQHSSRDKKALHDLWGEARPESFFGGPGLGLTPEWQFLYLATHAAAHKWHTLKWLADIHELCVSTAISWHSVEEKTQHFELESVSRPTATACSMLFGTPLSPDFRSLPAPAGVRLFPDSLADSESWNASLFYPRLLNRPSEKLRWFAQMFFVARTSDRRLLRLPESLSFLYYLLRPLRLGCKWTWLLFSAGVRRLR